MVHLSDVRRTRGFTQAELGVLIGATQSLIAKVEGGVSGLSGESKARVIRALDLNAEEAAQVSELALPRPMRQPYRKRAEVSP